MSIPHLLARVFVAFGAAALSVMLVIWLAGEATVAWYMHRYQIATRIELSEDYGFGMLALLVECGAALVAVPLLLIVGWRASGRLLRSGAEGSSDGEVAKSAELLDSDER